MTGVIVDGRRLGFIAVPATAAATTELAHRCSPGSLRRRFFLGADVPVDEALARYGHYLCAGPPEGVALLALAPGGPVGLLNLLVVRDGLAEAGLLVADAWQRRGVGSFLLNVELGRRRWAGWTVRSVVQHDNVAVRQLLRTQRVGSARVVDVAPEGLDVDLLLPGLRTVES
jgi:GNAT superfamily N-acetyltransferase